MAPDSDLSTHSTLQMKDFFFHPPPSPNNFQLPFAILDIIKKLSFLQYLFSNFSNFIEEQWNCVFPKWSQMESLKCSLWSKSVLSNMVAIDHIKIKNLILCDFM